jgi:hypothetical protein
MPKLNFVVVAALLSLLGSTSGRAQVTIEVAKITCEQFLRYKITDPKNIFLWLSGYYNAKRNNDIIDPQALDKNYEELRNYCAKDLQMTVMQAVESTLGARK